MHDVKRRLLHVIFTNHVYADLGRLDEKLYYDVGVDPDTAPQPNEITDYLYDAMGRQTQVIQNFNGNGAVDPEDRETDYVFDDFGRLDTVTTPEGTVDYDYNSLGQLERTATGTDPVNSPTTATEYTYDRLGRLETITAVTVNGTADGDVNAYNYDSVGNLAFVIIAADATGSMVSQYSYDERNRLDLLEHYYDANNNQQFDGGDRRLATFEAIQRGRGKRRDKPAWNWECKSPTKKN